MKVTFIGLGVMGFPMAGHLVKHGFDVTVYNRTHCKAEAWLEKYQAAGTKTPMVASDMFDACRDADVVFSCISKDEDLLELTLGINHAEQADTASASAGVFSAMKKGSVFIDHSTVSADCAEFVAFSAKANGVEFLDAPVSGGQAGAENGALTVMVGGNEDAFNRSQKLMDCFAKAVTYMGASGNGQRTKMVNQICIAGLVQALSEGVAFSQKCADAYGLDPKKVLSVISKGAAQSWQMENRGETMVDDKFDFGFAVEHMRKDLAICLAEAQKIGADLPVTAQVNKYYAEVEKMGGKRWDTSSLVKRLVDL